MTSLAPMRHWRFWRRYFSVIAPWTLAFQGFSWLGQAVTGTHEWDLPIYLAGLAGSVTMGWTLWEWFCAPPPERTS